MKARILFLTLALMPLSRAGLAGGPHPPTFRGGAPVDGAATAETKALFRALRSGVSDKLLVGQTDANIMGVNRDGTGWSFAPGRCDIKEVTGDYPAIYGFDLVDLEHQDPASEDWLRFVVPRMKEAYSRGGIVTAVWHAYNPLTGEPYDQGKPVPELLPGAKQHRALKGMLDRLAGFLGNLKDERGRSIPVIFRPWHEMNIGTFWWGAGRCTAAEYKSLYRFTVEYLRDVKKVHNFLYAYSPTDWLKGNDDYLARYPGDDVVDVLGLDTYGQAVSWYKDKLKAWAERLGQLGDERGKIAAFTEIGCKSPRDERGMAHCGHDFYLTEFLLPIFANNPGTRRLRYLAFWRNEAYNPKNYYLPYPGSPQEKDLLRFYQDSLTLFEKDLPAMYR